MLNYTKEPYLRKKCTQLHFFKIESDIMLLILELIYFIILLVHFFNSLNLFKSIISICYEFGYVYICDRVHSNKQNKLFNKANINK